MLNKLKKDLNKLADPKRAKLLSGFFKTGKGEYGEGDVFLGLTVPLQRQVAKKYLNLKLTDIQKLLTSKIHEYRLIALFILMHQYEQGDLATQKKIVNFYLKNTKRVNNWDLVDLSAHKILGHYLFDKDKKILYKLAKSNNLWEKRIAILSTFYFIEYNQFNDSLKIGRILLYDKHDLIHKALGWMLREVGKRDQAIEERFLKKHYQTMPRTMLRYAIERFTAKKRKFYLGK